jgi:hypothetical protein
MGRLRWLSCWLLVACGPTDVMSPGAGTGGAGESFEEPPYDVTRTRLEQTADSEVAQQLSLACSDASGTKENSWYRVFPLRDYGVSGAFTVHRVNFGAQTVIGDQRLKVSIGTYGGNAGDVELDLAKIDVLGLTTIPAFEGRQQTLQANFPAIEVPAGSNLIVEVRTEGTNDGRYFYIGATQSAETIPGYLRAPTCRTANPTMTSALGFLQTHLIISVSGSY